MFLAMASKVPKSLLERPNGGTTLLLADGLVKFEPPGKANPPRRILHPSAYFWKSLASGPIELTGTQAHRLVGGLEHTNGSDVREHIWSGTTLSGSPARRPL